MQKTKLSPRRLSRSLAVQALYHFQTNKKSSSEIEDFLQSANEDLYMRANYELMHFLIDNGVSDFDKYINKYTPYSSRSVDEIQVVERSILVIAAIELEQNLSVPAPVIINEAIELAKLYGGEDSFKFVNGLIDKLANELRAVEMVNKR
ncbi:MAG: transcription antitermination factor NusB [Burkholderiales bacterium]|nr:transcription antitermination factor NusB [Burkholderiales bacterium]